MTDGDATEESPRHCLRSAASFTEEQTMNKYVGALCTLAVLAGSPSNLFAQGSRPSQLVGPTAQAPATPAPATPPTFPTSEVKAQRDRPDVRAYVGTIVRDGDAYVLKAAKEQ